VVCGWEIQVGRVVVGLELSSGLNCFGGTARELRGTCLQMCSI